MTSKRAGFSLIEVIITMLVGSILVSIAMPSVTGARGRYAVTGARSTFSALHARARAQAIERGTTVRLVVDMVGDSASIWSGTEVLETVRFGGEMHVDIRAESSMLRLCMTPRGYADPDCNNFTTAPQIEFRQNTDTASLTMLPLGQLVF